MSNIIAQTIEQISKEKNVDPKIIISALEDAMVAASRKFYKTNEDINARFDPDESANYYFFCGHFCRNWGGIFWGKLLGSGSAGHRSLFRVCSLVVDSDHWCRLVAVSLYAQTNGLGQ